MSCPRSHARAGRTGRADLSERSARPPTTSSASLAELLASKPDDQLLGQTEFEVRDRVHGIGAKAIEAALDERKKGVPGVQPELPGLPRGGPVRRLPAQGARQPAGAVRLERAYYHCRPATRATAPATQVLGLTAGDLTPGAARGRLPGRRRRQLRRGGRGRPAAAGGPAALGVDRRADHRGGRPATSAGAWPRARPSAPAGPGPGTRTPRGRPAPTSRSTPPACASRGPAGPRPRGGWPRWRWSTTRSPRTAAAGPSPTARAAPRGRPATWPALEGQAALGEPLRRQAAQVGMDRAERWIALSRRRGRAGGLAAGELRPGRGGDPRLLPRRGVPGRPGQGAARRRRREAAEAWHRRWCHRLKHEGGQAVLEELRALDLPAAGRPREVLARRR